jgi:Na+/phosphate symporter
VIGGWFFTAMMAFTVSFAFAAALFFGRAPAAVGIALLTGFIIYRTHRVHRKREAETNSLEVFNLRKIKDSAAATAVTVDHMGTFLREVRRVLNQGFDGLFEQNRSTLKDAREGQRRVQLWSNVIAANVFKVFRLSRWEDVERTQRYAATISSLQEISESLRDIVVRAHLHVANNHSGLLAEQVAELDQVRSTLVKILDHASRALRNKEEPDQRAIADGNRELRMLVNEFDQNQIMRIQANRSKTRLSILFYSLVWDSLKIAEQATRLFEIFDESLRIDAPRTDPETAPQPAPVPEPA